MILIRIKVNGKDNDYLCCGWDEVYNYWLNCPSNSLFYVEIDGEFEEFTQEDVEERERAELLERLSEESQEDATEKGMY